MVKTKEEIFELRRRYGQGLALIRQVCEYYDNDEDICKVLSDFSRSMLILDSKRSLFDVYLENHPDMRRNRTQ